MDQKNINLKEIIQDVQHYLDDVLEAEDIMDVCESRFCDTELSQTEYKICSKIEPDLLIELEPSFSQQLFKYIKQKGISEKECYKKSNIDRKLFSKIRTDHNYQPKKCTVFALIIGLELNLEEAEDLLESAGYSISHSIKLDIIIEYVLQKKIYDIEFVNEILYFFGCPILGTK